MFAQWLRKLFLARKRSHSKRVRRSQLWCEPLEGRQLCAVNIFVAENGNDLAGQGTLAAPYATLTKALSLAAAGDSIVLRQGEYDGGVRIDQPNITIRSHANERAVISAPITNESIENVIRFTATASGGRLLNVDVVGGFFYGVKIDGIWSDVPAERLGASRILIENCRIHDTGRDCIKITPGCDDIVIRHNEIYRSGRREASNAEGIDNVNGDRMVVRENYIHDIATNGVYAKGGSIGTRIERNLVRNTGGAGIMLGFRDTDEEWFDLTVNPQYYESIDGSIRNNIVTNTSLSGIALFGAKNSTIANNTLVNVAQSSHAGLRLVSSETYLANQTLFVPNLNAKIVNNIVKLSADSNAPMLAIEDGGLSGGLQMLANRYFHSGTSTTFSDDRNGGFEGGFAAWKIHIGGEAGSSVGSPGLGANLHLTSSSPCIDAGTSQFAATLDYGGSTRLGAMDIGADEFGGPVLTVPPPAETIGIGRAPVAQFAAGGISRSEAIASHQITVKLSAASALPVTVGYQVQGGTATIGADYQLAAGTLKFAPDQTVAYIPLNVLNDARDEANETIVVRLSGTTNALLGANAPFVYTIQDDDPAPLIQFAAAGTTVGEGVGTSLATVRLSAASGRRVTVAYRTASGTASGSADYQPVSGTLVFEAGQVQKTISIGILNDARDENNETFSLQLHSPSGAALGSQDSHAMTITDNDAAPVIRFSQAATSVDEAAGTAAVQVSLSALSGKTVRVNYAIVAGTAGSNDFTPRTGTLSFEPGQQTKTITVPVNDDELTESNETFRVVLSSPTNGTLTSTTTQTVTIRDDDAVGSAVIVFTLNDQLYRIEPKAGASPVNVSQALDQLSPGGDDQQVSVSPNGRWLALVTDRFGMSDWAGLAVVSADLSQGSAVKINGQFVHPAEGSVAIASSGNLIVYSSQDGPHVRDLWAATKSAGVWTSRLLTAGSPYAYNSQPAISADGTKVVFEAGAGPYGEGSEAICEVRTDGTGGFRKIVTHAQRPAGAEAVNLHHADYAPNGAILFEAGWTGDQIWILDNGTTQPRRFSGKNNEVSPCVLPDGRVITLWLGRDGNPEGAHELTVRSSTGVYLFTLLPGMNVDDVGISCGA